MTYSIVRGQIVQTLDDGRKRTIPAVQGNGDYADYLAWVALGNTAEADTVLVAETLAKQLEVIRSEKKPSLTFTRQSVSLAGVGAIEKVVVEGATKGVAGMFAVSSGGVFAGGTFGVGLGASTTLYNASDTLMVGVSRQGKVTVRRSDGSGLWDVFFDLMIV